MTERAWSVPGYEVVELLGTGRRGQAWLARSTADGQRAVLRYLRRPPGSPGAHAGEGEMAGGPAGAADSWVAQLRRVAALPAALPAAHLLAVRQLVPVQPDAGDRAFPDGAVLVCDLAPLGDLGGLLRRRLLDPAELVTVIAPLAATLAVLHDRGWGVGAVSPNDILFDAQGRPLLDTAGLAPLTAGSPTVDGLGRLELSADADVRALAMVCRAALRPETGTAATSHALQALEEAVDAALDPRRSVSAEHFAAAVHASGPAAPVRFPPGHNHAAPGPAAPRSPEPVVATLPGDSAEEQSHRGTDGKRRTGLSRHRSSPPLHGLRRQPPVPPGRWFRRVAMSGGAALAMASAVAIGASGAAPDSRGMPATLRKLPVPASQTAPVGEAAVREPSAGQRWTALLTELDRDRSRAYAQSDGAALQAVYAPGSPALAADSATLRQLQRQAIRATGLTLQISKLSVVSEGPDAAELAVVDVLGPYQLRLPDGSVRDVPGRGSARWTVRLLRTAGGWRIHSVAERAPRPAVPQTAAAR